MPGRVIGMVLLDPSHPDQLDRDPGQREQRPKLVVGSELAPFGIQFGPMRVTDGLKLFQATGLPDPDRTIFQSSLRAPRFWEGIRCEMRALESKSLAQARAATLAPAIPVVVFTSEQTKIVAPLQHEMNNEWAAGSERGEHHVMTGMGHGSVVTDGQSATAIAAQVERLATTR
jgi:pimeloyl-ACP methyl ester carboxylesterase